jgi:hypothetical protein
MAEEFLNRLNKLEEKIDGLGETLMRMITILGNITEVKSDFRVAKEEILEGLKEVQASAPAPGITREELKELLAGLPQPQASPGASLSSDEVSQIVKGEFAGILEPILASINQLRDDLKAKIEDIEIPEPVLVTSEAAAPAPKSQAAHVPQSSAVSPDRAIQVADQLERILDSLKMGCKAGDVLDLMTDAKSEITKVVPSDPVMVKIDKWTGIVNTYSLRHELQAKDILKLKKDLKEEISKYRPV